MVEVRISGVEDSNDVKAWNLTPIIESKIF